MSKSPVPPSSAILEQLRKSQIEEKEGEGEGEADSRDGSSPYSDEDELLMDDEEGYEFPVEPAIIGADDGVEDIDELKARLRAAQYELAQVKRRHAAATELLGGEMSCAAPPEPRKVVVVGNVIHSARQAPASRKGITIARMAEEQRLQARNLFTSGISGMKQRLTAVATQVDASGRNVRRVMRRDDRKRVELFLEACLTSGLLRQFAGTMAGIHVNLEGRVLQQQMVASALLREDGCKWTDMPLSTLAQITGCDAGEWGIPTKGPSRLLPVGSSSVCVSSELSVWAIERPYDVARLAVMEPTLGFVPVDEARGVFTLSVDNEEAYRRLDAVMINSMSLPAIYPPLVMGHIEPPEHADDAIPAYSCPADPPSLHPST
jgi:hypothetical protein